MNNIKFQKEFDYFDKLYSFLDEIISIINQDGIIVYINKKLPDNINLIGEYFENTNEIDNKDLNDGIRYILENDGEFTSKYSVKYKDINSEFVSYNKRIFIEGLGYYVINHTKPIPTNTKENKIDELFNYNEVLDTNLSLICYLDYENKIVYSNDLFNDFYNDEIENSRDFDLINYINENYKLLSTFKINNAFGKKVNEKVKEYEVIDNNKDVLYLEVRENESVFLGKKYKQLIINDITTSKKITLGFNDKKIFSEIMEDMPLMVHSLNNRSEIVEVSKYWLEKLEYSYDEVIGKHTYDFMTESSREYALREIVPTFFKKKSLSNIPYTFITKSGKHIDVLMTVLLLKDRFGFERSFSISIDITERNNLYQIVKENEVLLNTIFENAPFGIEILDTKGNKLKVNKKIKELAKEKNYDLVMEIENNKLSHQIGIWDKFDKMLNGENLSLKEVKIDFSLLADYNNDGDNSKNSKIGYYDFYFSPILKYNELRNQKETDIIICFVNDITEDTIHKSQLEFQSTILNNINDIVIAMDNEFKITYWNNVAEETYGFTAEETIGKDRSEFYINNSDDNDNANIDFDSVIEMGSWIGEIKQITKNGKELYVNKNATKINDKDGNFIGILTINRDITKRKLLENEFKRNKNLLDTIFDNAPVAIQIFDTDGKLIRMNGSQFSLVDTKIGYNSLKDFNIFDDQIIKNNNLQEYYKNTINGEIVKLNKYKYIVNKSVDIWGESQNIRYYNLDIVPLLDENNEIMAIASFYEDVTSNVNFENRLIENNNLFKLVEKIANIGAWELEIKNNKLTWSDQTYKIHGLKIGNKIEVESAIDFYIGKDKNKITHYANNLINNFEEFQEVFRFKDALGEIKWVKSTGYPLIENGELVKIYGTFQDVTESYEKDIIIKENEELISSINTNIKEALYRTTPQKGVVYANKATHLMFGFDDLDQMNGFGVENLYSDKNPRTDYIKQYEDVSQVSNHEIKFRRLDGTEFWGLNSFTKKTDENGEIYFDGAIIDITEIKEKEKQLHTINTNLEKLVKDRTKQLEISQNMILETLQEEKKYLELKSKFITTVSHEFRTPLTIIQTSIYLLEKFFEIKSTEQFNKNILKVNNAIKSMVILLDNVLNLNNYNLENIKTYKQEFNFYELILELIESHKDINKNKFKINLINELSAKDYTIYSDKNMIYQILNNLFENAVKYSFRSRIIDVSIKKIIYNHIPYLSFGVKDYGKGFDTSKINNLFNPIINNVSNLNIDNNINEDGINNQNKGLFITKTWLDLLNGHITYESELGKFTIAKIEIPYN